jgi:hypothetical protein
MVFSEFARSRTGAVVVGATVLVMLGGVGGAVAAGTSGHHAVSSSALHHDVPSWLKHRLEADGPYPGLTNLIKGDNSTLQWVGDSGATLQQSWVQCAPGKNALGGGFGQWDYGADTVKNIQIVTSVPATIKDGVIVDTPIPGDVDSSIKPNGWLVEGFNNNASGEVSVRPWVVCAVMK